MRVLNAEPAARPDVPRVLVVEDEPLVRHAIAEELRFLGACVIEAATAEEAWNFITSGAEVDLVFTDHQMPGSMTGAQLAARLREYNPAIAILVTSGCFNGPEWTGPVLPKPYSLEDTAAALIELARRSR